MKLSLLATWFKCTSSIATYLGCMATYYCFLYAASGKDSGYYDRCIINIELCSPFLHFLHDPRCYTLPLHPMKTLLTLQHHNLGQHASQMSFDHLYLTSVLPWVAMGCYGISCNELVITQRRALYTRYWHCMTSELEGLMALELWRHTVPISGIWRLAPCNN